MEMGETKIKIHTKDSYIYEYLYRLSLSRYTSLRKWHRKEAIKMCI